MKKTLKMVAALSVVATLLSGCITATVLMTKWAVDEKNEIIGGKVFTESSGTVYYSYNGRTEGLKLTFKENGKYIRTDKYDGTFTIITPKDVYHGNIYDGTYVHQTQKNGEYYYSDLSMVFPVEWFRWEKFADTMVSDNVNKAEGTEYITGKKCITFTEDNYKVAGYSRIYMYKKTNGSMEFTATRWKQEYDDEFTVPVGCKEVSGSIDFSENF